jgi:hypothetical protein
MVEQELLHLTSNGYLLGSSFCQRDLHKGGICMFVSTDQNFSKIDIFFTGRAGFVIYAVHSVTKASHVIILSLCRAPSG